jgi:DNA-binding XRE family transcriptional regulator
MTWTPGRIRDLWRESGLTQREFAAEYGLALATFKQHLNGRYPPDIHSRRRYAACEAVLAGGLPPSHSCPVCCSFSRMYCGRCTRVCRGACWNSRSGDPYVAGRP